MTSEKGRGNELVLLLDYQEDLSLDYTLGNEDDIDLNNLKFDAIESVQKKEAKIQIRTLSSDKDFGEVTYKLSAVKKMKANKAFLEMPMKDRNCQVKPFDECRTNELLKKCSCVLLEILGLKVS